MANTIAKLASRNHQKLTQKKVWTVQALGKIVDALTTIELIYIKQVFSDTCISRRTAGNRYHRSTRSGARKTQ
jgi:3-deoxy-D-arabino-heptulosonate 7-phosphate (DAHP) synthase